MAYNYTIYPSAKYIGDTEPKFHLIQRPGYAVQTYTFAEFDEKLKSVNTHPALYELGISYAKKAVAFDTLNGSVLVNIPRQEFEAYSLTILEALKKLGFPYLTFDQWSRKDEGYIEVGLHGKGSGGECITITWSPSEE